MRGALLHGRVWRSVQRPQFLSNLQSLRTSMCQAYLGTCHLQQKYKASHEVPTRKYTQNCTPPLTVCEAHGTKPLLHVVAPLAFVLAAIRTMEHALAAAAPCPAGEKRSDCDMVIERNRLSSTFSSQQQPGPHSPLKPPPPAPAVQTSAKPLHHPKPRSPPPPPPLWGAQPATNPCILSSTKSPSYMEPSGQMNVPWRVEERRCETVNGWRAKGDDVLFASCASIGIG